MFSNWSDGPRDWKWMVPGAIAVLLGYVAYVCWMRNTDDWKLFALVMFVITGLCGLSALTNYIWLVKRRSEDLYRDHMEALNATPMTKLAEAVKQMHPDAIDLLKSFGIQTLWGVEVGKTMSEREWVLLGADVPVRFGFIEYVLSKSGKTLFPKNGFAEGSKKWDRMGVLKDRDQYDALEKWMLFRGMVTRSHGLYKPAEFIPPFNPKSIMELMGFNGGDDLYRPEDEREVKQLSALDEAEKSRGAEVQRNRSSEAAKEADVPELTAEELEANRLEMEQYASRFANGKVPS